MPTPLATNGICESVSEKGTWSRILVTSPLPPGEGHGMRAKFPSPFPSPRAQVSHQLRQASRRPRWGFVKKAIEDTVLQGVSVRRAKHPMNRARLELPAD